MLGAFISSAGRLFRVQQRYSNLQSSTRNMTTTASAVWPTGLQGAARLNEYLARAHSRLAAPADTSETHLFIGNEGADLDSIVSPMMLAYASDAKGMTGCASVVNCARADLHLRGDAQLALETAGIAIERLVFIDEVDTIEAIPAVTLVDHNEPATHQHGLSPNVRSIVDHHADAGLFLDANPRVIELIGSASTLVTELHRDLFLGEESDQTAASLLLAAMVIDTSNLRGGTARDAEAVKALAGRLGMSDESRAEFFEVLQARKMAQGHLSTTDLLRRDYKKFAGGGKLVGIASSGVGFAEWSSRSNGPSHDLTVDALQKWAVSQSIDVLMIMTNFSMKDAMCRELLICAASKDTENIAKAIADTLASDESGLQLVPLQIESISQSQAHVFLQKELGYSRKKVAPLVLSCLSQL